LYRSSLWHVPSDVAEAYWSKVESAINQDNGLWIFQCSERLPDITVTIGNGRITIPGINMNFHAVGNVGMCMGGIQETTGSMPALAGDVFLKNLFVAFEHPVNGQPRLGFAQT
jgi:hypothetical protein